MMAPPPEMPDLVAPAPAPGGDKDFATMRFLGLIRDIRADTQNLEGCVTDLIAAESLEDPVARAREIEARYAETAAIFGKARPVLGARFRAARDLLENYPEIHDRYGDVMSSMENSWSRVELSWDGATDATDAIAVVAAKLRVLMGSLVFDAGFLTIPPRLNQHLRSIRVGQSLDFHAAFEDELPDRAQRTRVLAYLHAHPAAVEGVIDVDAGKIIRASPSGARRRLSFFVISLAVVLGGIGAFFAPAVARWIDPASGVAELSGLDLLGMYALVFAGGLAHIIVGALKQARSGDPGAFTALEEWALWIHIKEIPILLGIVTLWIGFIGLVILSPKADRITALAVGYSIDSVADLYLQRFETTVTAAVKSISGQ